MQPNLLHNVLYAQLRCGHDVNIIVSGVSMEPSLREGDAVTIRRLESYVVGDILVYLYKNNELLIHRLLRIENNRYFCKGDNALRLEDVAYEQIAGKVVMRNGEEPSPFTKIQLELSYLMSRTFRKNAYSVDKTKKSGLYRFYQQYIMKVEDFLMTYQRNGAMDYISADETSLAVFDPDSGDTHLFEETGVDILNCLTEPRTMEDLLDKLCEIYDVTPAYIRDDVEEFLAECVVKKVVIVQ